MNSNVTHLRQIIFHTIVNRLASLLPALLIVYQVGYIPFILVLVPFNWLQQSSVLSLDAMRIVAMAMGGQQAGLVFTPMSAWTIFAEHIDYSIIMLLVYCNLDTLIKVSIVPVIYCGSYFLNPYKKFEYLQYIISKIWISKSTSNKVVHKQTDGDEEMESLLRGIREKMK